MIRSRFINMSLSVWTKNNPMIFFFPFSHNQIVYSIQATKLPSSKTSSKKWGE